MTTPFIAGYASAKSRYTAERNQILARIRAGKVSASMSGIEYYHADWDQLNPNDKGDMMLIRTMITGGGALHFEDAAIAAMIRDHHPIKILPK